MNKKGMTLESLKSLLWAASAVVAIVVIVSALSMLTQVTGKSSSGAEKADKIGQAGQVDITKQVGITRQVGQSNGVTHISTTAPDAIKYDIEKLRLGDKGKVEQYFGESNIYTPDYVKDRMGATEVTILTDKSKSLRGKNPQCTVHICTLDFLKTKQVTEEIRDRLLDSGTILTEEELNYKVKIEVATVAQTGKLDLHITLPVELEYKEKVEDGKGTWGYTVKITEAFKAALTGGWYNPTNLAIVGGECVLESKILEQETVNNAIKDGTK